MMRPLLLVVSLFSSVAVVQGCICETFGANSYCFPSNSDTCKCKDGYEPTTSADQLRCSDVDECADSSLNNCVDNAQCNNKGGDYECVCKQGFEGQGDVKCTDIDECAKGTHQCGALGTCVNNVITNTNQLFYKCNCSSGYALLVGRVCSPQTCSPPISTPGVVLGSCEVKLPAVPAGNNTCQLGCAEGYMKTNGTFACSPNNIDGNPTSDRTGVLSGSITCTEQTCKIGDITANYGVNALPGNCNIPRLNAVTGTRSCTLDCADGFKVESGGTLQCAPDNKTTTVGKLSGDIQCAAVSCSPLIVAHSNYSDGLHGGRTGDTFEVACSDGYIGDTATATCNPSGSVTSNWTGGPKCVAASCGSLNVPHSNLAAGQNTGNTNDTLQVTCDNGYIGGTTTVTCSPSGDETSTWANIPTCSAASCGSLNVPNSNLAAGQNTGNTADKLQVTCDDGYIGGTTTVTCSPTSGSDTATWKNIPPCSAAKCGSLTVADSENADGITASVGDILEVKCENGQAWLVKCQASGKANATWKYVQSCEVTTTTVTTTTEPPWIPIGSVNFIIITSSAVVVFLLILAIIILLVCRKNTNESGSIEMVAAKHDNAASSGCVKSEPVLNAEV